MIGPEFWLVPPPQVLAEIETSGTEHGQVVQVHFLRGWGGGR